MERGIVMALHSVIIASIVYVALIYTGYREAVSENRSLLVFSVVLIYMILFGHGLPVKLNKNI
jgi:hypothetical protein